MEERGIIIADRDTEYSSQIAEHFRKAGYRVETTDSAAHVLCSILEKRTPVLLLGSDFDRKVSTSDLIQLLKKCNRHLNVIVVSEEMPLPKVRRLRQEGIFYHALKPVTADDTEELGLAVRCAFERNAAGAHPSVPQQPISPERGEQDKGPKGPLQAAPWLAVLMAVVCGVSYLAWLTAQRVEQGNDTALWLFLSFSALIVATQLLPIFGIHLPWRGRKRHPAELKDPLDP